MKVMVTGHRGYIGPHVVDLFTAAGHQVTGCDIGLFKGCNLASLPTEHEYWEKDFRLLQESDLEPFDAIVHLAALSNDPMGAIAEEITYEVNLEGTVNLARAAKQAGVSRFLFAGSCSVYGKGADDQPLDETAPLDPQSAYAKSKVMAEQQLQALRSEDFAPVILRNATAYGWSPMLRTDLVVNDFVSRALILGEINILSDGTPWRPLVHCRDIAAAFLALAEAPTTAVSGLAVNIGADAENYQVKQLAEIVHSALPRAEIRMASESAPDPRNYRVNFDLLRSTLPGFTLKNSVTRGVAELVAQLKTYGYSRNEYDSGRLVRLNRLKTRLHLLESATASRMKS